MFPALGAACGNLPAVLRTRGFGGRFVLASGVLLLTLIAAPPAPAGEAAWRKRTTAAGLTVAMHPLDPSVLFAEGSGGAVVVSRDRGASWGFWSSPDLIAIRQILVHPLDTSVVLCAAGSGGLRRTTDNGATWSTVLTPFGIDGESIAPYPGGPDTLYAGNFTDGAIYRSADRGATWQFRGISSNRLCALAVKPDEPLVVCAGTGGGTISRSTDGGVTWSIVKAGTAGSNFQEVPFIGFHPLDPSIAYATTYGSVESTLDVWKSTDGGLSWSRTALQQFGTWALAVDPVDPDLLYVGSFSGLSSTVHRSTDGGGSWVSLANGLPSGSYMWSLKIHPADREFVALSATAGFFGELGIFRLLEPRSVLTGVLVDSATGDTVRRGTVRNLSTGDVSLVEPETPVYALGYYDGDPTMTPTISASAYPYRTREIPAQFPDDSTATADIAMIALQTVSLSGEVTDGITGSPAAALVLLSIARSIGDTVLAASTDSAGRFAFDGLFESQSGINEYPSLAIDPDIPFGSVETGPLLLTGDTTTTFPLDRADVFIVSPFDDGAFAGYYRTALDALGIRSAVWNETAKGPAPLVRTEEFHRRILIYYTGARTDSIPGSRLDSLAAVLGDGSHLLLMGQNLVEANAGHRLFSDVLRVGFAANTHLAFNRSVPGEILAGLEFFTTGPGIVPQTSRDVLAPLDPGTRGILDYGANTGGTAAVRRGESSGPSRALVVGFGLEAVYSSAKRRDVLGRFVQYLEGSIVTSAGGGPEGDRPSSFALAGNYPNPFNPATTIVFEAPERRRATVVVYDLLGRPVGRIFDGIVEPGRNAVVWDAGAHPAGVYFYRISAPGAVLTGRMLLVR